MKKARRTRNPWLHPFEPCFSALILMGMPALGITDPLATSLDWSRCAISVIEKPSLFADFPKPLGMDEVNITADSTRPSDDKLLQILEGNVFVIRQQDRIRADLAIYNPENELIQLSGNVVLETDDLTIETDRIEMTSSQDVQVIENVDFSLKREHAHGHADSMQRENASRTLLKNTSYTTCNPDAIDWEFRAKELRMEHDEGMGIAKGMSLQFKNIPIFYFPSLSFPMDNRRKSGFLLPNIGRSNDRGYEFSLPYYWNIAPQTDATITPRWMSRRGLQVNSEWRYLAENSRNQLEYATLDDQGIDPLLSETQRQFYRLTHTGRLGSAWTSNIDVSTVSDNQYFNDLGNSLSIVSVTHLTRQVSLGTASPHWRFQAQALNFQTLDPALSEPYSTLPKLNLLTDYPDFLGNLSYTMNTEWVAFDHTLNINAQRFDINPRLSWLIGTDGWYLLPAISSHHSQYRLDDKINPVTTFTRTIPTTSLDAGLFLERDIGSDNGLLQTIEPRFFYVETPYRDQSTIPLFDTSALDFSFAQLFRDNRYTGIDRIADTQQATFALTSRILEKGTGMELFRGSIGQISYFKDRYTNLSGTGPVETQKKSDLASELQAQLSQNWALTAAIDWNRELRETSQSAARLHYKKDQGHILNIGYRFRDDSLEQSDISAAWPISDRWSTVARWNRSLTDDVDLERFLGFEYKSCCYSFRIAARRYLNTENLERKFDNAIFLQLSFTGFASLGQDIGHLLEQGILGYRDQTH